MDIQVAEIMERNIREKGVDRVAARIVVDIYFDRDPDPMAPDYEAQGFAQRRSKFVLGPGESERWEIKSTQFDSPNH